jgi:hypothetical protein
MRCSACNGTGWIIQDGVREECGFCEPAREDEITDCSLGQWLLSKTPYCEVCTRLAEGTHVILADGRGLFVLCEECFSDGEPYKSAQRLQKMREEPIRDERGVL